MMRTFTTFDYKEQNVTRNFLQLCYMCDDKHLCATEETCRACWTEQGVLKEEGQQETQKLMNAYYA
ncbi:hypothetical protein [Paenibacillus sp. SC116]|uniref:hypothetical protein n=1 Tax=Paenibacillus sp. SC116 TaxID=2968986 RepID=UPI0035C6688C